MNPIHALILFMAGLLALFNNPLNAQEKPAEKPSEETTSAPAAPPPPPPGRTVVEEPDKPRGERPRSPSSAPEKLTPFIGVLTTNVSPELRAQFGLQEGFGLQVIEIMPDSPAKTAGLKEHDILLNLDDQKLVSMEQLQVLVRSKKKDDQITFTLITGGKQTQVTLTVSERMMPVRQEERRGSDGRFFPMNPGGSGRSENFRPGHDFQDTMERFQSRMRDYQERLQEWGRGGRQGAMPTPPMMEGSRNRDGDRKDPPDTRDGNRGPRGGDFPDYEDRRGGSSSHSTSSDSQRSASVTRRDESGTYSLHRENGRSIFTVRSKEGEEKTWSFTNETEGDIVPEQYRDKLRMLQEVSNDMHRDGHPRNPGTGPRDSERGPGEPSRRPPPEDRGRDDAPAREKAPSRSDGTF